MKNKEKEELESLRNRVEVAIKSNLDNEVLLRQVHKTLSEMIEREK